MANYTVTVTQYNCFDIEADNPEEAKRKAVEECIWDESDSSYDCNITVKEED